MMKKVNKMGILYKVKKGDIKMYSYIVFLKNGKEYIIKSNCQIEDFMYNILPKQSNSYHVNYFDLSENKAVVFLGSEVSSVEYFIK